MLAHPGELFDVTPFIDSRCKTPIEEIQAAVDRAISPEQASCSVFAVNFLIIIFYSSNAAVSPAAIYAVIIPTDCNSTSEPISL